MSNKVNLLTIFKQLPHYTTLGDIDSVVKGRQNFAPEHVDAIIAEIEDTTRLRIEAEQRLNDNGKMVPAKIVDGKVVFG